MIGNKTIRSIVAGWGCIGLVIIWTVGCSSPADNVHHLTAHQARSLIERHADNKNFINLDVRTSREYRSGHVPRAVLMDFHSPVFPASLNKLDRSKTYLIYCQTGYRSSRAVQMVEKMGFTTIYHLQRGVLEWYQHRLPLVRS